MYKIGIRIDASCYVGGTYQYWLAILRALAGLEKREYEVVFFSSVDAWITKAEELGLRSILLKKNKSWIQRRIENNFKPYHTIPIIGKILSFLYSKFDSHILQIVKENIDLFISLRVDGIGDYYHIPTMVPIWDLMHRYEKDFEEVKSEYAGREKIFKHQCKYAEIILADSKVGKEHILESYGNLREDLEEHIAVLPFVPPDYIYATDVAKTPSFELPKKYFFYPAQFWSHKNHENLLKAQFKLKEAGINTQFVFVGSEKNNGKRIAGLIHEYGLDDEVKILGYVSNEEMIYLYKNARALIMPTFFGPTNIPQLEAFELGCPVATSNIYAIPEQVGDAALLFNPRSIDEIANAMQILWTDDALCSALIEKGKIQARHWGPLQFERKLSEIIDRYKKERRV